MKIIIDFDTDNAAFQENFEWQVRNILEKVKIAITADNLTGKRIKDWNGNTVGSFIIKYK